MSSGVTDAPIVVLVRLRMHAGREDDFVAAMTAILEHVRREPGCLAIDGHRAADDPGSFMLYEVWRSEEAFAEFESSREYMRAYMARVMPWWSEPRELTLWRKVS
jgi:quinol monooxygenase YgiN